MMSTTSTRRLILSAPASTICRRKPQRAVYKSVPRCYGPCVSSSPSWHNLHLVDGQRSISIRTSTFFGDQWRSSRRHLSSSKNNDSSSPSQSSYEPQQRQIYVWEQTISSATANAAAASSSSDSSDADKSKDVIPKGRVLYRPVSDLSRTDNENIGWEVATSLESRKSQTNSSLSASISSTIQSFKNKDTSNIQTLLPFLHHFLPANYPHSVCPSYSTYASYCFLGSIAGSSAMVLSTQALLVAVGVGTSSAAPMAAALNWVMKDGIGQMGGVVFASQLGRGGLDYDYWRSKLNFLQQKQKHKRKQPRKPRKGNFQRGTADTNPKRWRMVAALALDLSTLLEICTPMMGPEWFLPCASVANIGKNVGFLAASASRAAIHQSLSMGGGWGMEESSPSSDKSNTKDTANSKATKSTTAAKSSNLGDVTAKSGSQSIVASLLGTALGILLSRTFCSDHGTVGILAGFVVLSAVHQICTYRAVKAVPLRSLDRHRLHIVLEEYCAENYGTRGIGGDDGCDGGGSIAKGVVSCQDEKKTTLLSPSQVAKKESFLPMMPPDDSVRWLSVGDSLMDICPSGMDELEGLLLPKHTTTTNTTYYDSASASISAFDAKQYEKYILKVHPLNMNNDDDGKMVQLTFLEGANDHDLLRGMFHAYTAHAYMRNNTESNPNSNGSYNSHGDSLGTQIMLETYSIMNAQMPVFTNSLREVGWQIGTGFVNVECGSSHRLKIQSV